MPPTDVSSYPSDQGPVRNGIARLRRIYDAVPVPIKLLVLCLCVLFAPIIIPVLMMFAPFALWRGTRDGLATASVTAWGLALVAIVLARHTGVALDLLLVLPIAAAFAAHAGTLGRWYSPCRTAAWVLLLAIVPGVAAGDLAGGHSFVGPIVGWVLACAVLGWRLAKAWQGSRQAGVMAQVRGGGPAQGSWPQAPPQRSGPRIGSARPGQPQPGSRPPAGVRPPPGGARRAPGAAGAQVAAPGRAGRPGQVGTAIATAADYRADQSGAELPVITVEEAMAELDEMIGLAPVKEQVRSIAASIEAARRRALAGIGADKPMQHLVFLGPPGTGKTAVARIVARRSGR
jgi:hypothetical protein